jgi:hypothetical protein
VVHEHFTFPWKEDVITPVSKLFGAKELQDDADEVLVGHINEFVYFAVGEVEIWLREITGTFPQVEGIMKPADNSTYLILHPTDVQFLLNRLDKLPGRKDYEAPVYITHNNKVWVVRAHDKAAKTGVTLELSRSALTGEPVSFSVNRQFLKNALQFGCWKIGIDPMDDKAPVICTGDDKTFICVLLKGAEPEAEHMDVISSTTPPAVSPTTKATAVKASTASAPQGTVATPAPAPVKRRRKVAAVKRATAAKQCDNTVLLESAEQVRDTLRKSMLQVRDSLTQVNDLIRTVKSHRRQERLLQNTMDSLRKLNIV